MNEPDIRRRIDQALAALRAGDYVRALALGDQLASEAPELAVVRAIRAQALLGADSPQESFQEARRAVELAPDDEYAQQLLALSAWRTERLALAQESFERAIAISERRSSLLAEFAWFMANERGPKLAEQAAREAVEACADCSTAWAALGLAQFRLHRPADAEKSLRCALELDPNDIYAQSAMVALLHDCRQDERADALVDLLQKHAGTEEVVAAVREEAKQRQIERMLVERKVDVGGPAREPPSRGWIWMVAAASLIGLLASLLGPIYLPILIVLAIVLLYAFHRLFD